MMKEAEPLADYVLKQCIQTFRSMKKLGDGALAQLEDEKADWSPEPESNSAAVIVKHMAGNMASRWTNFLTSDGEKPWRDRDTEFDAVGLNAAAVVELWERGWAILLGALDGLTSDDLLATVFIRSEPHSVLEAIHRQISHYAAHTGQLVYVVKAGCSSEWRTLSIAKGESQTFNDGKMRS